MPVDFTPEQHVEDLRRRVEAFVRDVVIPAERGIARTGPDEELRRTLQSQAKAAGLLAPTGPERWGGLGLDVRAQSVILREAGYSLLGPLALNCAAPDEGNMHLLHKVATPAQQERYLAPLVAGQVRSCFAMTEPSPGAGSDPSMLATSAEWDGADWVISGRKWFITGADGAAFAICTAATPAHEDQPAGATMFLVDSGNPGMRITRHVGSIDIGFVGGHCEVEFDNCRVPADAVLGEVGLGFRYAQVAELGMTQQLLADNEIDLAAAAQLITHAAWLLDTGHRAGFETSIAKTFVAEAVNRVVDRAVQVHGALGVSDDLPLALFLREVRPFRIYDGASEVHRMSIAKQAVRRRTSSK
jgi:acyl-CoA dehydrogenase